MNSSQHITLPISNIPTHILVWNDAKYSENTLLVEVQTLKNRIEQLEQTIQKLSLPLLWQQTESIPSTPRSIAPQTIHTPLSEEEIIVSERVVTLNGMDFIVRTWKEQDVYCEESTGRAFVNPNDAFTDPEHTHIGYWNSEKKEFEEREIKEEKEESIESIESIEIITHNPVKEEKKEKVIEVEVKQEEVEIEEEEEEVVVEEEEEEEQAAEEEKEQAAEEEEEEEVLEEEEEEEVVEEEEQEEEAINYEEFEYKGSVYAKDPSTNYLYQMDEEGSVSDEPFGMWNEAKQKIVKIPTV